MRFMPRRMLLVVGATALAMAMPISVQAGASVQHVEVTGDAYNSCTNELMDVHAKVTGIVQLFVDPVGGSHLTSHFSQIGFAVGYTSGTTYVITATQSSEYYYTADALYTGSFLLISTYHVAGQGGAPDLMEHTTSAVTIVNGEVKVVVLKISFTCA